MRTNIFILALVISVLPALASAESVMWNKTVAGGVCSSQSNTCRGHTEYDAGIVNPNITITYHVRVVDSATGAEIPRGSTVPQGTVVRYEFVPHVYNDIYWFGTGQYYDSPYGDWVANGDRPAGSICLPKNDLGQASGTTETQLVYGALSVAPPVKTLNVSTGSCTDTASGKTCTLSTPGTVNATFNFAPTVGYFYIANVHTTDPASMVGVCTGYSSVLKALYAPSTAGRGWDTTGIYTLNVPVQTIDYPITVIAAAGTPPSTPSLNSGGACTIGTPHAITISANDPDGDRIRYGIDWDADGSIDEYMPSSGYVSSGTSQTASRIYATAGSKTVKVLAQDEGGLSSDWATINFNCSTSVVDDPPPPPPPTNCPVGYTLQDNICVFSGCPSGFTLQGAACVMVITQCTATNFCIGDNLYHRNAQCTQSFIQQCIFGCTANACRLAPAGSGDIVAQPTLVTVGGTTNVTWQTNGMVEDSCVVTDDNPVTTTNKTGETGSFVSEALNQPTTFTLTCTRTLGGQFADSVIVNIVPVFIEN